jgi:mRNA interferase MazF
MGRRPALYNARSGLAVVCSVTSQLKGYPFEVRLPEGLPVRGAVLADHIKSLDWRERQAEFVCNVPADVVRQVLDLLDVLLQREG